MKPKHTWIVVADGARARVLLNKGPGKGLEAMQDLVFEGDHSATRDIMADRPGRTFESGDVSRHAKEYSTDPHQQLKRQFVDELCDVLAKRAGEFDRLVLVAPPEALGLLRKSLPSQIRQKVRHELHKDLTHVANADLPGHLAGLMAL